MIVERLSQKIIGTFEDVIAIEKKFDELEAKIGNVPAKRRYLPMYGRNTGNILVWEREWENLAALEAYQGKISDPEWQAALKEAGRIFTDFHFELFRIVNIS